MATIATMRHPHPQPQSDIPNGVCGSCGQRKHLERFCLCSHVPHGADLSVLPSFIVRIIAETRSSGNA